LLTLSVGFSFAQPPAAPPTAQAPAQPKAAAKPKSKSKQDPQAAKKRADALRAIMKRLDVGQGATVADIGAGNGRDTWVFADVVGQDGRVYAEEIGDKMVQTLKKEVEQRDLPHVQPILGRGDDPCLPAASADMAYMHYVYHHFSQPREMLAGLWRALKPGGYLVIADRRLGTLQDWVPRETRASKHYWIAETTVVREAREGGFLFVDGLEECWPADDQFVLVFQRPAAPTEPGSDPDPALALDLQKLQQMLLPAGRSYQQPVFIALGEARQLMGPILAESQGAGLDVVLEEWATQKEERPPLPQGVELPSVLTEQGAVQLGDDSIDAVFFLDTYHLLFHQAALLADLHKQLASDGKVFILDRKAESDLSRREASHRRQIPVAMVKQEMAAAGFRLLSESPSPAEDRFLMVFGK
jgi:predicted methyltransferase